MNKLLLTVKSTVIALLITGCTSIPTEDADDHPWNNSMDMQFRDPGSLGEEW